MKLLLDTHTFLWFIAGSPSLSEPARNSILLEANRRLLSIASLWEIVIKASLGRLDLDSSVPDFVKDQVLANAIELLGVSPEHLEELKQLPFHHKDPLDRLIAAQARVEGARLVSRDRVFDEYGFDRIWD